MSLVEADGCIFDEQQLGLSRGFEALDPVAHEAFVNHLHIVGEDRQAVADRIVRAWATEMRCRWPDRTFRIYRQSEISEIVIRFHVVRLGVLDWSEGTEEIIEVGPSPISSAAT